MLTWTLHEDKKGLSATGKEQSYWICETSRLRVREGRDKPMALFVRREKKVKWFNAQESYGFINHVVHSCYTYMSEAVQAAEGLETAADEIPSGRLDNLRRTDAGAVGPVNLP